MLVENIFCKDKKLVCVEKLIRNINKTTEFSFLLKLLNWTFRSRSSIMFFTLCIGCGVELDDVLLKAECNATVHCKYQ